VGKLVLRLPDGTTREFALDRERVTIGRRADNDVCLPFPAVSGEHAAVVTILDDSFLEDLNSTNGTLVNGKAVAKHFLRDNDEIDIGRQLLVYVSGDYRPAEHHRLPGGTEMVAVTTNGGATIGDDEATLVPPPRESSRSPRDREPLADIEPQATNAKAAELCAPLAGGVGDAAGVASARPVDASLDSAALARTLAVPALEVLDGPNAGRTFELPRADFVVGRPGVTLAAIRERDGAHALVHLEGGLRTRVNGVDVSDAGRSLASGDEIDIAGTRLRYHAGL
jgi:pSer/pThr/pTyr-binding forkhead associated (FHA) protein